VYQEAYAKALSDLSGVDVTKLLPVPEIDSAKFPHARELMDRGFHKILYRFSPDDYKQISEIWNGDSRSPASRVRSTTVRPRAARYRT
jgi:Mn-containing catalase